jgi:hypothetical protein
MEGPALPRYGEASLAELTPALLGALGAAGFDAAPRLGLGEATSACLLLVDGLGDELLTAHADAAPTLAAHRVQTLTATYPSTTATSITSLGTGLTPGEHGMVGYLFEAFAGTGSLLNALRWQFQGSDVPLFDRITPEAFQPEPTAFERASGVGVSVTVVSPPMFRESGLTRVALRGGRYVGAPTWGALADGVGAALRRPGLVYAYVSDLDTTGHTLGPSSAGWRAQLAIVDRLVAVLAESLPPDAVLVVTGDHGMVDSAPADRIDLDAAPPLRAGVRAIGGEPRARYVYATPGAAADVAAAWREELGERAWVLPSEQAVEEGWFGPRVSDRARSRLGDVVAAARERWVLVRPDIEPHLTAMRGHHGSLTPAELAVPLVAIRG